MDKSWIASLLPTSNDIPTTDARDARPRWQADRSTASTSILIPAPIVNSIYGSPTGSPVNSHKGTIGDINVLSQRQQRLETDLQQLLDFQGQCLTAHQLPTKHSRLIKPDILQVRKALYSTVRKLAVVKLQDFERLQPKLERLEKSAQRIDTLTERRERLNWGEAEDEQQTDEKSEVTRLRLEADQMADDIREAEQRLHDLKKTQKRLRSAAEQIDNRVQSRLNALIRDRQSLEREMSDILAPYTKPSSKTNNQTQPGQMSLGTAHSRLTDQLDQVQQQRDAANKDYEALVAGAKVWRDVTTAVSSFEDRIAADTDTRRHDFTQDEDGEGRSTAKEQVRETLHDLHDLMALLETKFNLAEEHDWKLLICAIGAELEAVRQGKEVLEAVLADLDGEPDGHGTGRDEQRETSVDDDGDQIRDLDRAFVGARPGGTGHVDVGDDDDPDPNLLLSNQDDRQFEP